MFNAAEWSNGSNIYEVNIRQYTHEGTFNAFAKHLSRIKDMGVKILWLMPVTPISIEKRQGTLGSYYACSDYTAINTEFGTLDDFKRLVKQVHEMDMRLIIDWVANHTGWDHVWTKDHADWYMKDANGNFTEENNWKDVIDLNYENKDMKVAMINAMNFWVTECDIDGFRCDMAHLVPLDFWKDARTQCDIRKPLFWLAECDVEQYHDVFDVSYAWHWMHVTENMMRNTTTLLQVKEVLINTPASVKKLYFTTNHDENSWNGTEYEKYGNAAKPMAVFTCIWPGMPLIYGGQELPLTKRLKFFDKDEINWNNKEPALHSFYKTLLTLRRENNALHNGTQIKFFSTTANDKILAYLLSNYNNKILVLLNFSAENKIKIKVNDSLLAGKFTNVFTELTYSLKADETFELQAYEYLVYASLKNN